jgi:hypothetical protein
MEARQTKKRKKPNSKQQERRSTQLDNSLGYRARSLSEGCAALVAKRHFSNDVRVKRQKRRFTVKKRPQRQRIQGPVLNAVF